MSVFCLTRRNDNSHRPPISLVARYKYCRIDGQTSGDDRESQIDDYNAEGSDIFVFLLSTRAGTLDTRSSLD